MTGATPRLPSMLELATSAASSAAKAKAEAEKPNWPTNAFQPGIQPDSATDRALKALEAAYPRWLEAWELMRITGRSRGAIAWGMQYLQRRGLVQSIQSARHPQYLRYRLTQKEKP